MFSPGVFFGYVCYRSHRPVFVYGAFLENSLSQKVRARAPYGPWPIWALAHMGLGPYGPWPISPCKLHGVLFVALIPFGAVLKTPIVVIKEKWCWQYM